MRLCLMDMTPAVLSCETRRVTVRGAALLNSLT